MIHDVVYLKTAFNTLKYVLKLCQYILIIENIIIIRLVVQHLQLIFQN